MKDTKNKAYSILDMAEYYNSKNTDFASEVMKIISNSDKISEYEWASEWVSFDKFNESICKTEKDDTFKKDDKVEHAGREAVVKDCCGMNFDMDFEYYIEYCDDKLPKAKYVTNREIKLLSDKPPEVPKTKKVCRHKNAYENVISGALRFWVCPDCKEEVSPPGYQYNLFGYDYED